MGRARRFLPLRFDPKKPADATAFFANRHEPNRRPNAHNRKARTERTLLPCTGSSLRTEHGPTDPVLEANPSSEGTDPESVHLGDLLRMVGTDRLESCEITGPGFSRAAESALDAALEPQRSTGTFSVSPDEPIPWTRSFTKKRELFPGLSVTSPSSV